MHEEDLKNLIGWLQAIYKEAQTTRGAATEMRHNIDMVPEIRDLLHKIDQTGNPQKLEEVRNHLENQLRKMEDVLNELRSEMRDIKNKIDHLK